MGLTRGRFPREPFYTGARIPAIGLGTFGSDRFSGEQIADAVVEAASVGYRHFDCAAVYQNEQFIGHSLQTIMRGGVRREDLWVTSKLWNDKHAEADVIPACEQSLAHLQLDYLDLYLVHWPFPNYHPPGCDVASRSPDARPYIHEDYMKTWRQMEKLVDRGLARHIGTSNMTIPKLDAGAPGRPHQAGLHRDGAASSLSATRSLRVRARPRNRADRLQSHRLAQPARPRQDRV